MKKKGSLELSINAIVILVLAITLLGLGLTFIRGLFGKATDKLGGFVDATDLDNPPTAENPISIPDTIEITAGSTRELKVGFYNKASSTKQNVEFTLNGACSPALTALKIVSPTITVKPSNAQGFKIIISVPSGTSADTYVCEIATKISTVVLATKQVFIKVVA